MEVDSLQKSEFREEQKPAKEAKPRAASTENLIEEVYWGTAEQTYQESSYHRDSLRKPYNTDDLYCKTGDYSIYEEMKFDDQIAVCMQLKKDMIIGSGWTINSDTGKSNNDVATEIYTLLEDFLEESLDDQLEEFIDTQYTYGFALAEKVFRLLPDNRLTLNCLKTRHPATWLIHTDRRGRITNFEQRTVTGEISVNPNSLMHAVNNKRFQNPYGRSDLRPAYNAWFSKRQIVRYLGIFAEKSCSPIPAAKYENNTPQEKVQEMFDIVKKFMARTAIVYPKAFDVEFLEVKSKGETYFQAIDLFNMFIGRALFVPDLLGFTGSKSQTGGSQALGREQIEVFIKHIHRRRRSLERMVNRHIIRPIAVWNYGMMEEFPKFQLNPITDEDAEKFATLFISAVNGRLFKPSVEDINHFKELIKFPIGPVEFFEDPMASQNQVEEDEPVGKEKSKPDAKKEESEKDSEDGKSEFSANLPLPDGDYHKRVNFKAMRSMLDSNEAKLMAEAKPLIDDIFEDLYDQIEKKKVVGNPDKLDRLESLSLKKLKPFQLLLKKHFRNHYSDSRIMARSELFKQNFAQPEPSDRFLEVLEQETFQYIGRWEYEITDKARRAIINAIKDGKPLASVITMIDIETKREAAVSLERYSRTKFTEVMNKARLEEFQASKVVQGVQYSAILDGRTTEICMRLHGKKFALGTEPIPPMHFNCRSTLIPITIFEDFEPDKKVGRKDIGAFIEENKGKGFATR